MTTNLKAGRGIPASGYARQGYTKYPVPAYKGTHCTALWQKWVRGEGKKLYALNLYTWELPWELPNHHGVEVEVRMYTQDHEFNLNLLFEDDPVRIEAFYADAYIRLGCIPDPHNND